MDLSLLAQPRGITLVMAPHAGISLVTEITARQALTGTVRVLDCGNRYNVYPVAKAIRRLSTDLAAAMQRVLLSRAFTCYQVQAMLMRERTHIPVIVVDLLATFLDEDVSLAESQRLLRDCITGLTHLSQAAPVLVTVSPLPPISTHRALLLEAVMQAATTFYEVEESGPSEQAKIQPLLWKMD